jgi:hypothetical protein
MEISIKAKIITNNIIRQNLLNNQYRLVNLNIQ